jgi:hypothetical protein
MRHAAGADPRTFILHWNGRAWSQVRSPSPGTLDVLEGVGATSAASAWAVGFGSAGGSNQTLILRWNGSTWRRVPSPNPGGSSNEILFGVTATSAGNAWAVGDFGDQSFILRWDGLSWQRVPTPVPSMAVRNKLFGVAASSAGNAWAVGAFSDTANRLFALHCT